MRGGRGGVRVGMRGTFNKKASFSEYFNAGRKFSTSKMENFFLIQKILIFHAGN